MSLIFTLRSTVHDWGWPKNGLFWTKMTGLSTFQSGPKGSNRVQNGPKWSTQVFLTIWDAFGPFRTKINFSPQMDKEGFGGGATGKKINLCLKWSKEVLMGQKGSQMVKNTWIDRFGPF